MFLFVCLRFSFEGVGREKGAFDSGEEFFFAKRFLVFFIVYVVVLVGKGEIL